MLGQIRRDVAIALCAIVAIVTAACGAPATVPPTSQSTAGAQAGGTPDLTPEQTEITSPLSSMTANQLPLFIAADHDLWKKYGLTKVDLTAVSSTQSVPLFLAGRVNILTSGGYVIMSVVTAGGKAADYGFLQDTYVYEFYVQPEINSFADLKGKAIGISAPGGLPHLAAATLLKQNGVDPKDVTFVATGDVSNIVNALIAKQVAGGAFGPPATAKAKQSGLKMLVNMVPEKVPSAGLSIVANPDWVAKNPKTAMAYMKGILEGIAVQLTQKDLAMQILAKRLNVDLSTPAGKAQIEAGWQIGFDTFVRPADIKGVTPGIWEDMVLYEQLNGRTPTAKIEQVQPQPDLIAALREQGFFKYLEDTYGKLPPRP